MAVAQAARLESQGWVALQTPGGTSVSPRERRSPRRKGKWRSKIFGPVICVYSFEDLGLDLATERARYAAYQAHYGVASEVE